MSAGVERTFARAEHRDGAIEFPVATLTGARHGPTLAVITGMHGGEYTGPLAAIRLIQECKPAELAGRLIVIPVISTRAFLMRSMQLSPVDDHEVHYVWPGHPQGSYSEALVDLLYATVKDADYLLDLHAGEMAQALDPYVCVPWVEDGPLWDRSLELARAFDVPFVDRRVLADTPLALPRVSIDRGIPNIWTEIGDNGRADPSRIALQYNGIVNVLHSLGMAPGECVRFAPRVVGPKHWNINATRSGIWRPAIAPYAHVRTNQLLGKLHDYFGEPLEEYRSPADALVEIVASSPAINADREPHGYAWHRQLVQLVEDPDWNEIDSD
jgi:predicted deacylase